MNLNQETKTKNIWYRRGKEPIIEAKRKGESTNFYGALNLKTGKATAMEVERQNGETTVKFLKKLARIYKGKKIFLIWDNATWHKCKEIKEYLKTTDRFELFNFPPYSPEFNPQEHIWRNLRQNVTHNRMEKNFPILIKDCLKYLKKTDFGSIKFENIFGRF